MIFKPEFEACRDSYIKNPTFPNSFIIFFSVVSSQVGDFFELVCDAIVSSQLVSSQDILSLQKLEVLINLHLSI